MKDNCVINFIRKYKIKDYIVPIFSVIILELIYFISGIYNKSIITENILSFSKADIQLNITRIFLLLINLAMIYIIANRRSFSSFANWCPIAKRTVFVAIIRLILDVIAFVPVTDDYQIIWQTFIDTVFTMTAFYIYFRNLPIRDYKFQLKKSGITAVALLIISFVAYAVYFICKQNETEDLIEYFSHKYISEIPAQTYTNIEFENNFRVMLYRSIANIIACIFFISSYTCGFDEVSEKPKKKKKSQSIFARCFFVLFAGLAFAVIKTLLFPCGLLGHSSHSGSNSYSYSEEKEFDVSGSRHELFRATERNTEKCTYTIGKYKLSYDNDVIKTIRKPIVENEYEKNKIDDSLYTVNAQAVMYLDNDKPVVVMTADINSHKENEKLTETIIKLIDLGYFDYLEYSYDYLLKYNSEYLKNALTTFSYGNYNPKCSINIREDYIKEFAETALERDFKQN